MSITQDRARLEAALTYPTSINGRLILVALVHDATPGGHGSVDCGLVAKRLRLPETTVYHHLRQFLMVGIVHRFPPKHGPDDLSFWRMDYRLGLGGEA